VRFAVLGVNAASTVAQVRVFAGNTLAATVPVTGKGMEGTPLAFDLTAYANVTRVELARNTDLQGIGLDNLAFELQD
jgi:hypothetical protein